MKNIGLILKMMKFWAQKKNPLFEIFMKGRKVLDIGCGEGNLLRKDKEKIYGIDINKTMVEKLQKESLKVKYGNATDIPFDDKYFDVVYCSNVIEHLFPEEARKMFLEIKRVLKESGIIILITPIPKIIWNTFGHIKPYPPSAIKKLFRETSRESFNSVSGLNIKNIFYFGSWSFNKLTFLISTIITQMIPVARSSYFMIIEKSEQNAIIF